VPPPAPPSPVDTLAVTLGPTPPAPSPPAPSPVELVWLALEDASTELFEPELEPAGESPPEPGPLSVEPELAVSPSSPQPATTRPSAIATKEERRRKSCSILQGSESFARTASYVSTLPAAGRTSPSIRWRFRRRCPEAAIHSRRDRGRGLGFARPHQRRRPSRPIAPAAAPKKKPSPRPAVDEPGIISAGHFTGRREGGKVSRVFARTARRRPPKTGSSSRLPVKSV